MCVIYNFVNWLGKFIPQLLLRLVVAWQAWDAGLLMHSASEKVFAAQSLPPFSWMQTAWVPDFNFTVVMWWQLVGALFVLIGFRTRIVVLGLIVLTISTLMATVQFDGGTLADFWRSTDIGEMQEKIALLYLFVLVALFFLGSGSLSVDAITGWFGCGKYAKKARKERKLKRKLKAQEKKAAQKQEKLDEKAKEAAMLAARSRVATEKVIIDSPSTPISPSSRRKRRIRAKENIDPIKEPTPE